MAEQFGSAVLELRTDATAMNAGIARADAAAKAGTTRIQTSITRTMAPATASFRNFGNVAQQAGFQVGDFAVQVASGQGALRPLIQQGTQFLQVFGPVGSVIGAAGAVIGALAVGFLDAGEEAKTLGERIKEFQEILKGSNALKDEITDIDTLRKKYGEATEAVIRLINRQRQLKADELRTSIGGIAEKFFADLTDGVGFVSGRANLGDVAAKLGIGGGLFGRGTSGIANELTEVSRAITDFAVALQGASFEEQALAAERLREAIARAADKSGEMSGAAKAFMGDLDSIALQLHNAASATGEIGKDVDDAARGADDLANGIATAASNASGLTAELQRASRAMASIAASAQDRLARAQMALQFRGDPAGLARAAAERGGGQLVAAQQKLLADSGIPALMRQSLIEPIKEYAAETVTAAEETARLEAALLALTKASSKKAKAEEVDQGERLVAQLRQRAAGLQAEAAAYNLDAGAAAEFLAYTDAINAAVARGIELSPEQIKQLQDWARQIGVATGEIERMDNEADAAADRLRSLQGFASDLGSALMNTFRAGGDAAKVFAREMIGIFARMVDTIIEDSLKRLAEQLAGAGGGGGGGFLSGILNFGLALLGGIGSGAPTSSPVPVPRPPSVPGGFGMAEGGSFMVDGNPGRDSNLFAVNLSKGERVDVTPAGRAQAGAGGVGVVNIDARGADMAAVARLERVVADILKPGVIERRSVAAMVTQRRRHPNLLR